MRRRVGSMRRRWLLGCGSVVLVGGAFLLGGCEEKDVGAFFGAARANVAAMKVETAELSARTAMTLCVETSNGSVTVHGVAGIQTVSVTATLRSNGPTLAEAQDRVDRIIYRAEAVGDRINLRYLPSEQDEDVRRHSSVGFDVLVPTEIRIEVDTSNGMIGVERIVGTIRLGTSNGAIEVYDAAGSLSADTSNGRIEVVRFTGNAQLGTSNGELWLDRVVGAIVAETSNGSVRYSGAPMAASRLRTSNGSLTVRVPPDASIAFRATTSGGQIRSTLPLVGVMQGSEWNAVLNPPADVTFDLRTSSGSIRIEGDEL